MSKQARPSIVILSTLVLILSGMEATNSVAAQTLVDIATDATDPRNLRDSEPSIAVNPINPKEISIVSVFRAVGA